MKGEVLPSKIKRNFSYKKQKCYTIGSFLMEGMEGFSFSNMSSFRVLIHWSWSSERKKRGSSKVISKFGSILI